MTASSRARLERLLGHPLSQPQWIAVQQPPEPMAIIAGAGSGKTAVMSARMAWLAMEGVAPAEALLGLTFTTKAAAELLRRVRGLLARARELGYLESATQVAADPTVSTYHSFAAQVLSEHGVRIGLEPGAGLLSDGTREELALAVVRATSVPLAGLSRRAHRLAEEVLALDGQLAELCLEPSVVRDDAELLVADLSSRDSLQRIGRDMLMTAQVRAALATLVEEFRDAKRRRQSLDFADQVRLAHTVLTSCPDVRELLRTRHQHVLLDEYQDTSVAQRMLMQAAFGDGHSVTAVGDPCQSIYGWRGASVDNIDQFPQHFPAPDGPARRLSLADNRRSGPGILEVANVIAEPLRRIHPGVQPLVPAAEGRGPGVVRCALLDTVAEELEWVADRVAELGGAHGPWSDIAVLARTGETLVAVEAVLRARGIPAHLVAGAGLLDVPVVAELRAILEVVDDPTANDSCVRLLTGPRWRIGPRDLAALGRHARDLAGVSGTHDSRSDDDGLQRVHRTLREAVLGSDPSDLVSLSEAAEQCADVTSISEPARERLLRFAAELRRLRRHRAEPPADLIGRVLALTGLGVEAALGDPADVASRSRALAQFRDLAGQAGVASERAPSLGAFLERLRRLESFRSRLDRDDVPAPDAVTLMTVHRAKGLEFPHVVLPGLTDGVFPSDSAGPRWPTSAPVVPWHLRDDAPSSLPVFPDPVAGPRDKDAKALAAALAALEEADERRLAYVAVTRAERTLTVSGHWWGPRQKTPRGPSPYLEEIRAAGALVDTWAPEPEDSATNPALDSAWFPWPVTGDAAAWERRRRAAEAMSVSAPPRDDALTVHERERVEDWRRRSGVLREEARRRREPIAVEVPPQLSASDLIRLREDPTGYALDLVRPMPRRPHPAARRGTALHSWIEGQYAAQTLFDLIDLDSADDVLPDPELQMLRASFLRTPYAARTPLAVEAPFSIVLGGRVLRGRIDAVFEGRDGRHEVVDWKTGARGGLHDLQLGIYRLAWSELAEKPLELVDAAFVLFPSGDVIVPPDLPGAAEIAAVLSGP